MTHSGIGFRAFTLAVVASVAMASAGLADDKKKKKTIEGALIGAGVGALVGDGKGAAIGGVAGAIIGHNWK
ncbi:YMGG-like glycine zipper-containing protein [Ruegeria sp. R14_0]|uniref:YMGG-like glycine zipper-containing protein n=1 Tax=Ruegeria sp. R14_0 TaxID=2821100 RepID=UPI001ADCB60E|nr:YMGG-like glycine zipper-containing protein [Ruegeria sp. R14_0]MBO9447214.1 hypothetical protein [Ruegeria sp. R14_0]